MHGDSAFAVRHHAVHDQALHIKLRHAVGDDDLARDARGEHALAVGDQVRVVNVRRARTRQKTYKERDGKIEVFPELSHRPERHAYRHRDEQRYEPVKMRQRVKRFGKEDACRHQKREKADRSAIEQPSAAHRHLFTA